MIERLVFISTMVLLLMVGVNGFIVMGNMLCDTSGHTIGLTGAKVACNSNIPGAGAGLVSNGGIGLSNMITDANSIQKNDGNVSSSTTAPGSAESLLNFVSGGISAAYVGVGWLISMLTAGIFLGLMMANLIPFLSPIIYIFVAIIAALEGFALMYWTMAGARAFLGRFL